MPDSWQKAYKELQDFIAAHPEVVIERGRVSIPNDTRGEFYQSFDTVREAFVDEKYPALPVEVVTLSDSYNKVERAIIELLKLESISILTAIQSFLHNPKQGLMREIYNNLFDLLQGKIEVGTFEQEASRKIDIRVRDFCKWGYEMWLVLSLLKLLEPEKAYQLILDTSSTNHLEETKNISVGQERPYAVSMLPDFIVYSNKVGKYVALKSELRMHIDRYYGQAVEPEERKGPTDIPTGFGSRVLIVHFIENPENIILADSDTGKITNPEVAIECLEQKELHDVTSVDEVKHRHELLKPRLGTYLVFREPVSKISLDETSDNIHFLEVGLDQSKLESIISLPTKEL